MEDNQKKYFPFQKANEMKILFISVKRAIR